VRRYPPRDSGLSGMANNYSRQRKSKPKKKRLVMSMNRAPVSSIPTISSGIEVQFAKGRHSSCMRMRIRFRICQVITKVPSYANGCGIQFLLDGGTNRVSEIPLYFTNQLYFPSYIWSLARLFDYTYVNGCSIHYMPRVNTTNESVLVFAYASDPEWAEAKGQTNVGFIIPSEGSLTSLANSCTDVAYARCQVFAKPSQFRYFNDGPSLVNRIDFSSTSSSVIRESVNGMFLISGLADPAAVDAALLGDVYMNLDFELCNFSLTTSTTVLGTRTSRESKRISDIVDKAIRNLPFSREEEYEMPTLVRQDGVYRHINTNHEDDVRSVQSLPRERKTSSLK